MIASDPSGKTMTYGELHQNLPQLVGRMVRITGGELPGKYWKPRYNGYTNNVSEAGQFTPRQCVEDRLGHDLTFELVDDEEDTGPPVERKERVLLGVAQAVSNIEKLGTKMCRVVESSGGRYWRRPLGSGVTKSTDLALEMRISTVAQYSYVKDIHIEMLDQEMAAEIAKLPFRKCLLSDHIPLSLITGLKLQPSNPTYRALLLKKFNVVPPSELTTYEALQDWIEFNCDAPTGAPAPALSQDIPTPTVPEGLSLRLEFNDVEVGHCRYKNVRSHNESYTIRLEEILRMVAQANTWQDVKRAIDAHLAEHAWDCEPDMESGDSTFDYDDYNLDTVRGRRWAHRDSSATLENDLRTYLKLRLPMEERIRLGLEPVAAPPRPPPDPFNITTTPDGQPIF